MIPAGGSGKVLAKVATRPTQAGRIRKTVILTTDAPVAKTVQLKVEAELVPAVEMTPGPFLRLEATEGESATGRVLLHRTDGKPFDVTNARVGEPELFSVEVVPVGEEGVSAGAGARPGDVWVQVAVAPQHGYVSKGDRVTLATNHPALPELTIPVSLRVRPVIQPTPARVRFRLTPQHDVDGASTVIVFRHNRGEAFAITGVESSLPDLVAAEVVDQKSADGRPVVRVTVPPGAAERIGRGTRVAELTVHTDASEGSELRIPVHISTVVRKPPVRPETAGRRAAPRRRSIPLRTVPAKRVPRVEPAPTATPVPDEASDGDRKSE